MNPLRERLVSKKDMIRIDYWKSEPENAAIHVSLVMYYSFENTCILIFTASIQGHVFDEVTGILNRTLNPVSFSIMSAVF